MSLQDQLKQLHLLDRQVRALSGRLDSTLNRTRVQSDGQQRLEQQHAELLDQVRQLQVKAAGLENEATDIEQRIAKLRDQMNTVKSNKEYSALLVEVNTLKLDKSKIEDEALEQMTLIDDVNERIQDVAKRIEEQKKVVSSAEMEVDKARDDIGLRLEELTAQRDAAANGVPADVLSQFNRLADGYDGEAVTEVQEQNRRRMEYICGGCYMTVPVEHVNILMTRPDDVVNCPSCSRILCIDKELKAAIGSR